MAEYRAYVVGAEGHFIGFEIITGRDDADAITKARGLMDGHDIEIWLLERFVIRLKHKPAE